MLTLRTLVRSLILAVAFVGTANAQLQLAPDETIDVAPLFDARGPNSLKCFIEPWKPVLDFAFRFVAGYAVNCRLGLFAGRKATVMTYLRITPRGGAPTFLGSSNPLPEITPDMLRLAGDPTNLKNEFTLSGAFSLGEGQYSVEVVVTDDQKRVCHKRWNVHASRSHSERSLALAIPPLTVVPLDRKAWELASPQNRGGLHLTVMLDAVPIFGHQSRLYAWDRLLLLELVYSLLRQTPYQSVRLVAFTLHQQQEFFRVNQFDTDGLVALAQALKKLETATVSVQALRQINGPKFLVDLTNREYSEPQRSDAVIFLGPNSRLEAIMGSDLLAAKNSTSPPLFYFEYSYGPGEFADEIQHLMQAADGRTFSIHSPAQLDQAIQKMLAQLKQQ